MKYDSVPKVDAPKPVESGQPEEKKKSFKPFNLVYVKRTKAVNKDAPTQANEEENKQESIKPKPKVKMPFKMVTKKFAK